MKLLTFEWGASPFQRVFLHPNVQRTMCHDSRSPYIWIELTHTLGAVGLPHVNTGRETEAQGSCHQALFTLSKKKRVLSTSFDAEISISDHESNRFSVIPLPPLPITAKWRWRHFRPFALQLQDGELPKSVRLSPVEDHHIVELCTAFKEQLEATYTHQLASY